ncbi:MAG TPA: glycine--tRNA ligase subunit beta [Candidatus Manganitrophaceae bacterium]|nr:glycine--tRNA ligase subunit beta [Candidatus Manganitrophaceae bacterium]
MSSESKRRTRSDRGEKEKTSPELFVEIGVEEIPSNVMAATLQRLRELAAERLKAHSILSDSPQSYGTPRRLILHIPGVSFRQETKTETITGPAKKVAFDPQGNPTPAATGFAKSQGVAVSDLTVRRTEKGDYLAIEKRLEGQATFPLLEKIIPEIIGGLTFPRSMRWNKEGVSFVRPIRWIVALYDGKVVPFSYAGVRSGNSSTGHRIMAPEPFRVKDFASYQTEMRKRFVMIDPRERYQKIREEMQALADEKKGKIEEDESLVWQAAFMVEYPKALCGSFDRPFLEVPKEVIMTAMKEHQGYFPLQSRDGALLPNFITIINVEPQKTETIQKGNERVLRARLVDAKFYFGQDRKSPLINKVQELNGVTFQEKLGTLFEKTQRLFHLAGFIVSQLNVPGKEDAERAASLCKADLVSGVVREFPSLQGVMGRVYAALEGENPAVAQAIEEHYLPRYSGGPLPKSHIGQVVAIADKLDTIVGCFGAGLIPSGSEDPYALRRQGLGIIQIVVAEEAFRGLSIGAVIDESIRRYKEQGKFSDGNTAREVVAFLKQRLGSYLESEKVRYDLRDAVLSRELNRPSEIVECADALVRFSTQPLFGPLMTVFKRAIRILPKGFRGEAQELLLKDPAERALYQALSTAAEAARGHWEKREYERVLWSLATLYEPLNRFFDGVMVMDENPDVRQNRLSLLFRVQQLFS